MSVCVCVCVCVCDYRTESGTNDTEQASRAKRSDTTMSDLDQCENFTWQKCKMGKHVNEVRETHAMRRAMYSVCVKCMA